MKTETEENKVKDDKAWFEKKLERIGAHLELMGKVPEESECEYWERELEEIESIIWRSKAGSRVWDVDYEVYGPEYSCHRGGAEFTVKYKVLAKEKQSSYPYYISSEYRSCEAKLIARPITNPPRRINYEEYLENEFPDDSKCKNIIKPYLKRIALKGVLGKVTRLGTVYQVGKYELELILIYVKRGNEKLL
jgi:hypothetical protein